MMLWMAEYWATALCSISGMEMFDVTKNLAYKPLVLAPCPVGGLVNLGVSSVLGSNNYRAFV